MIREVTREMLGTGLREVGLAAGDRVVVHSSIGSFGLIRNPLDTLLSAFTDVLGPEGCLIVPTFNFDFGRGEVFDLRASKSSVGVFSEHVRTRPDARPLFNSPFHSFAALGPVPPELENVRASGSFSEDSLFRRFFDLDVKMCLLGTDFTHATLFHYVEERCRVPYRFDKPMHGRIRGLDGIEREHSFSYFARRVRSELSEEFQKVGLEHMAAFGCRHTVVGLGRIFLFNTRPFVEHMSALVARDPYAFIGPRLREEFDRAAAAPAS